MLMQRSGLIRPLLRSERAPFMGAMFISNIGRNAYFVGMAWIALTWSNSMQLVALLLLVSTVAEFLSSGISGHLADTMSKRRLALFLDGGRAIIVLATGLLATTGADIWLLFLSMAIYSAIDRAYLTAMQAMIPQLTHRDSAIAVNSVSYLMMQSGNFVGALLIGSLLHVLPYGNALAILSGVFASSAFLLLLQREARAGLSREVETSPPMWRQAISWRYIADHQLVAVTTCYSATLAVGVLVSTLLSAYVLDELDGTSMLFGQLESAWAFGSVVACLCLAVGLGAKLADAALLPLLLMSGLALLAFRILPHPIASFVMLVLLGAFYNACRVAVDAHIQRVVSVTLVGRTKGTIQMIATGFGLAIYALIAVVTEVASASGVFASYGVFIIVVALCLVFLPGRKHAQSSEGEDGHAG